MSSSPSNKEKSYTCNKPLQEKKSHCLSFSYAVINMQIRLHNNVNAPSFINFSHFLNEHFIFHHGNYLGFKKKKNGKNTSPLPFLVAGKLFYV